jgi:hypothetical protein
MFESQLGKQIEMAFAFAREPLAMFFIHSVFSIVSAKCYNYPLHPKKNPSNGVRFKAQLNINELRPFCYQVFGAKGISVYAPRLVWLRD